MALPPTERQTRQPALYQDTQLASAPKRSALDEIEDLALSAAPYITFILMFALLVCGAIVTAIVRPDWLSALITSIAGPDHKMYWYASRSSSFVALVLLWLSMVLGLAITNKLAQAWPGGPTLNDLHEYTSLLGLGFSAVHALLLLGAQHTTFTLTQVLVPFTSTNYQPFWVGIGQIGLYATLLVTLSFYVRRWIGYRTWCVLHYLSFGAFLMALAHSLFSGSDSTTVWARDIYWGMAMTVLGLCAYRMLIPRRQSAAMAEASQPLTTR
ncbi:MAG: ferric reductase-like transmembrane domain-containing protein [Kouleothrix sp.]